MGRQAGLRPNSEQFKKKQRVVGGRVETNGRDLARSLAHANPTHLRTLVSTTPTHAHAHSPTTTIEAGGLTPGNALSATARGKCDLYDWGKTKGQREGGSRDGVASVSVGGAFGSDRCLLMPLRNL